MLKAVLINFLLLISFDCFSCSCLETTVKESIKNSDLIFTGKVTKIDTVRTIYGDLSNDTTLNKTDNFFTRQQILATIELKKIYKGKLSKRTVTILTGYDSGDCRFYFLVGKQYLIYSRKNEYRFLDRKDNIHKKSVFYTSICDRSTHEVLKEEKLLKSALLKKSRK